MAGLFSDSFVGSLLGSGQLMNHLPEHFQSSQGGPAGFDQVPMAKNSNGQAPMNGAAGATAAQPKQRVRARRGQATDPHSIAERLRRERIAERMKGLQELVPNANKGTSASSSRSTRIREGPTMADLRAELERTNAEAKAKEAEFMAREAESKAALEDVQMRLKAIEDMMRSNNGAAASDGASFRGGITIE